MNLHRACVTRGTWLIIGALILGCGDGGSKPSAPGGFTDITTSVGIASLEDRAEVFGHFMPESLAPGCALFDADGDGDLDIYLVNGYRNADGTLHPEKGRNRLLLQDASGRFQDVSSTSGSDHAGYGMGVAVGDVDGDGDLDLYVTNFGADVLLRNDGHGVFRDVTRFCGLGTDLWGASAGFCDFDGDGDLDLFVTQYVQYTADRVVGRDEAGRPEYPGPERLPGTPDILYENQGDGTFRDVSSSSGIGSKLGRGLGLVFTDLDGDGRVDVYVANDREANVAWIQVAPGRFEDRALALGLAYNEHGKPEASMGVALGDTRGTGSLDILLTHFAQETHTLYRQDARKIWHDETTRSGLGLSTLRVTGFGTAFVDLDHDGDLDLLAVNGRVARGDAVGDTRLSSHWARYAEHNQVFINEGSGQFHDESGSGRDFTRWPGIGRGMAVGDVDRDGDVDVLVNDGNGTVRLLRNDYAKTGGWFSVRPVDRAGREALGSLVTIRNGDRTLVRLVSSTHSYLSSSPAVAHFGLGTAGISSVLITWPDGAREEFGPKAANQALTLKQGEGIR